MNTINERLISVIEHFCDGNKAEFARMVGVKPQTINGWVTRDISKTIVQKIVDKIPTINFVWLLTGEGNMLKEDNSFTLQKDIVEKGGNNYRLVPVVHIDSVGGMHSNNSITDEPQYIQGYVPFVNAMEDDKAIIQSGNSMIPTIPPGSLVHIREVVNWREYFGYGNIFVIGLKDGRRITKEVQKDDNPDNILCVSHNPNVSAESLPKNMIDSVWKVINILIGKGW